MMEKDIADNQAIGDFGAKAILAQQPGDNLVRVLTHCNTGSLATAGYGTALGVIRTLHSLKKLGSVIWQLNMCLNIANIVRIDVNLVVRCLNFRTRLLYRN